MPDRPNILFLFTDDQRFDTIAALGNPHIHTPCMDQWWPMGRPVRMHTSWGSVPRCACRVALCCIRVVTCLTCTIRAVRFQMSMCSWVSISDVRYRSCGIGKWHNGKDAFASFDCGGPIFLAACAIIGTCPVMIMIRMASMQTRTSPSIRVAFESVVGRWGERSCKIMQGQISPSFVMSASWLRMTHACQVGSVNYIDAIRHHCRQIICLVNLLIMANCRSAW